MSPEDREILHSLQMACVAVVSAVVVAGAVIGLGELLIPGPSETPASPDVVLVSN